MHVQIPPFQPHPLVRGGHAQTVLGCLFPGTKAYRYSAVQHRVTLDDGDAVVLHDDCPAAWRPGDNVALLVHGLGGSYLSGYMIRGAAKLANRGVRVFRMDLRGWGAGFGLNRRPLHAGRSEDSRQALEFVADMCPESPVNVVGFSMGANMVLKMAGEFAASFPRQLSSVMGVSPPICLQSCMTAMRRSFWNRFYDRNFIRWLQKHHLLRKPLYPDEKLPERFPPGLLEYDAQVTAPQCGFADAAEYYQKASAGPLLPKIEVPTLVVAAEDDPIIPVANFQQATLASNTQLEVTTSGGHLGFVGTNGKDPDHRWIDWRVVDWVLQHGRRSSWHRPTAPATRTRRLGSVSSHS